MNKKTTYWVVLLWIFLSRGYDAYNSILYTPDLAHEANPLVSIGGISSWSTLLIILGILSLYVVYSYTLSVFRPMDLFPREKGYSFSEFTAYIYTGKKGHWTDLLYKFPKDLRRFNHYMGRLMPPCLVFAGIISTVMWILLNNAQWYREVHTAFGVYLVLIIGIILLGYTWLRSEYRKYQGL